MTVKIKDLIFKLIYIPIIVYLLIFVPTLWGYKPLVVISKSMEPNLRVGGLLYYHEEKIDNFQKEDILVFKSKKHIVSHRIVDITKTGFVTKGDANNTVDPAVVEKSQILGKGTNWSIPFLGYYADFIYRNKYILFISITILIIDLCNDYRKKRKVGVLREENS